MILSSSCIALLNSWSSLSKIFAYLHHSPDIRKCVNEQLELMQKLWKSTVTSSKEIPHDFCEVTPGSDWLVFHSSMARTKSTPREDEIRKTRKVRMRVEVHAVLAELPVPTEEAPPTLGKVEKRRVEESRLEEVGKLLESSLTWQLAQMATEAGLPMSGGEEPAQKKLQLTVGGKALQKEFLKARKVKRPQRYQPETEALHKICWFQKSTELLICKLPFSCLVHEIDQEVGKYNMHFQVCAVLTLQEAEYYHLVSLLEDANLCVIHVKCVMIMSKDIQLACCIHEEHLHYWVYPPPESLFQSFFWLQVVWDFTGTREGNVIGDNIVHIHKKPRGFFYTVIDNE